MPNNLSYPLNVEGDDQQGHYIMFMINETTPGKMGKRASKPVTMDMDATSEDAQTPAKKVVFIDKHLNSGAGKNTSTMSRAPVAAALHLARPPTTRMAQAITLYMPPSVKVSYKSNYKDSEIGFLASGIASAGMSAIEAFKGGIGSVEKLVTTSMEGGAAFLADKAMKVADTFAPGASTLAQLSAGSILGSKMEVMFTDVGRRNFSFTFNFIPKSEQEARMVYDIVQTFKEHMLPEYLMSITLMKQTIKLGQGRILKIPDTFDIMYFFHSNENPFLNRISTCYLTSLDVEYGGEKYVTYEPTTLGHRAGPPPQRTSISLAFTEIETITRERAEEGF
jgi:hypothetical protein